jgi:DNA-binding transcriptional ArsR family regulator
MKEFLIIKDPVVARLFADKTRRSILHNLRHKEMTSYQLAKLLEKNVSSISYHLNTLENANLIEQTKTAIKGNLVEKYYLATAHKFIISYTLSEGLISGSDDIAKWSKEVCKRALNNLHVFNFDVSIEKQDRLLKLIEKYSTLNKIALEEIVSHQKKPFHVNNPSLRLLLSLLTNLQLYNNTEFREIMDILSEILWK